MTKAELRSTCLAARAAMTPEVSATANRALHAHLLAMPGLIEAGLVLTYVSAKGNEVDTRSLIPALLAAGKIVAAPRTLGGGMMEWLRIDALDDLVTARFGLLEPPADASRRVTVDASTVVLVPGIAFTPQGYRVGFGGGYFDRFLPGFPGISIGLAFDLQMTAAFSPEVHDVPVQWIATESGTHLCCS